MIKATYDFALLLFLPHDGVKRLMTISGVDKTVALATKGVIGSASRFDEPQKLVS
ncbi:MULTISPECIES: hypothetical protein [unclassified Mesorhizobium]|uniref:hypothetical protein n=1 Tax=unclassified Mesorhizobium TaxID=325217 RepID=UPI0013E0B703|nr:MULTISPECIES: hypothetical protein [unclassified Mesorhizobium]